jgi:NAD(P)-dependent dehydrogenase (short-subunit alcohol dehydrogenase family)
VLNAGIMRRDALRVSVDGLELTLATNLLGAHALLALLSSHLNPDARTLIVGSNVIRKAWWHGIAGVPSPRWRPLDEQCAPSTDGPEAYARSKLGLLYLSRALNKIAPEGVSMVYFDPGVMPGTNILRERTRASQIYWREVLPHVAWTFGGVTVRRAARTLRPYALHEVPVSGWSHVCVRSKKRYVETDGDADRIRDYFDRANEICGVRVADTSPWWWQTERIAARPLIDRQGPDPAETRVVADPFAVRIHRSRATCARSSARSPRGRLRREVLRGGRPRVLGC